MRGPSGHPWCESGQMHRMHEGGLRSSQGSRNQMWVVPEERNSGTPMAGVASWGRCVQARTHREASIQEPCLLRHTYWRTKRASQ